jgi:hypothetical protein
MAKRGGHIWPTTVTGDAVRSDKECFWRIDHVVRLAKAIVARNAGIIGNSV